jgi:hypothetical protein
MTVLASLYQTYDLDLEYKGNHDIVGSMDSACADDKDVFQKHYGVYLSTEWGCCASDIQETKNRSDPCGVRVRCIPSCCTARALAAATAAVRDGGEKGPITIHCVSTGCFSNLKNFIVLWILSPCVGVPLHHPSSGCIYVIMAGLR